MRAIPAMVGMTIQKPTHANRPIEVAINVEIDGIGRVDIVLDEHQFAHFMGSSQQRIDVTWRSVEEL